jgi:hypothetical protein
MASKRNFPLRRSLLVFLLVAVAAMAAGFFFFSTGNMGQ